jgi:hypothetical protein
MARATSLSKTTRLRETEQKGQLENSFTLTVI